MRFGLCTGDLDVIRQAVDWGYDYVEIGARTVVPFEDERAFATVKSRLQATGTPIEAMAGFIPGSLRIVGPSVDWDQVRRYLETTIGRASEVGVTVINWGSAESRRVPDGWPMSRAWEQLEHAAAMIADLAEAAGIVVVVEPVNPRETNILYYVSDALHLVQTINRPGLKVIADYYHVMKQNEPLEHIERAAAWLAHAHTSDDQRGFPCLGAWDQRPFLQALVTAGYDGRISFEVARRDASSYAAEARSSVRRMRDLLRGMGVPGS